MRKPPALCISKNKGTDRLRSNWEADQHLCFRYTDTVKDQKYFHNVGISIDLHVFSSFLQENLSCVFWSTYLHDFGVI